MTKQPNFGSSIRSDQGTHVSILPRAYEGKYRSRFHYGSQVLFSTHSSAIVPKESPWKVMKHHYIQGIYIQSRPLVRSAFCPMKIDHTSGLTLHPGTLFTLKDGWMPMIKLSMTDISKNWPRNFFI